MPPVRPMHPDRPGFELALLLVGAFRTLVDALHTELAELGHPDVRAIHGFALQAVGPEGTTLSELGRSLGVSKQAAAKTAASLERLGYIVRAHHPSDGRAIQLRRSARGDEMLGLSADILGRMRAAWGKELGLPRIRALEDDLERIAASGSTALGNLPGWLR